MFTLRPCQRPNDFAAMIALTNASHVAEGVEEYETVESLNHFLYYPHSDPDHDIIVAEVAQCVVGYCHTFWRKQHDNTIQHYVFMFVHPSHQRQGIGTALLRKIGERLEQLARQVEPNLPHTVATYVQEKEKAGQAFAHRHGFGIVRYLYEMTRPLDALPDPDHYPLPAGVELRPALPAHDRAIYNARREAFLDHWGSSLSSEEEFQSWVKDEQRDPSLYVVAWSGDDVAGLILNVISASENESSGRKRGYPDPIAVRRPWRKQGLATAMLVRSLHRLHERGMTEAALSVDSENPNGALRIYERVGFRAVKQVFAYQKAITPKPGGS
ncbi:MAG: GNAT family N-acetyltransferase [Anaerolineae bacterium]|nr:GNAT family N-acetyltransferase [Anaerolineae bacterium]